MVLLRLSRLGHKLEELAAKDYGRPQPRQQAAFNGQRGRDAAVGALLPPLCIVSVLQVTGVSRVKRRPSPSLLEVSYCLYHYNPTLTTGLPNQLSGCFPPLCLLIQSQVANCRAEKEEASKNRCMRKLMTCE